MFPKISSAKIVKVINSVFSEIYGLYHKKDEVSAYFCLADSKGLIFSYRLGFPLPDQEDVLSFALKSVEQLMTWDHVYSSYQIKGPSHVPYSEAIWVGVGPDLIMSLASQQLTQEEMIAFLIKSGKILGLLDNEQIRKILKNNKAGKKIYRRLKISTL